MIVSGPPLDRVAEVISLLRSADYVVLVAAPGAAKRDLQRAQIVSSETGQVGAVVLDSQLGMGLNQMILPRRLLR